MLRGVQQQSNSHFSRHHCTPVIIDLLQSWATANSHQAGRQQNSPCSILLLLSNHFQLCNRVARRSSSTLTEWLLGKFYYYFALCMKALPCPANQPTSQVTWHIVFYRDLFNVMRQPQPHPSIHPPSSPLLSRMIKAAIIHELPRGLRFHQGNPYGAL